MGHQGVFELQRQLLADGSVVRLQVRGYSMLPLLRDGDIAVIEQGPYHPGDILAYVTGQQILIHRFVDRESRHEYLLRGDALRRNDLPIEEAQILGRLVAIERAGSSIPADGPRARILRALSSVRIFGEPALALAMGATRRIQRAGLAFTAPAAR